MASGFGKAFHELSRMLGFAPPKQPRKAARGKARKANEGETVRPLAGDQLVRDAGRSGSPVYAITLTEFRNALGNDWERLKPKIDLIAGNILVRHGGRGALYSANGDDCYTLAFPDADRAAGSRRAMVFAQELGQHLIGAGVIVPGDARLAVTEADGMELLDATGRTRAFTGSVRHQRGCHRGGPFDMG